MIDQEIYKQQVDSFSSQLLKLKKVRSKLGLYRLLIVLIISVAAYQGFAISTLIGLLIIAAGTAFFLFIVSYDSKNSQQIKLNERLLFINEEELKILSSQYYHRNDGMRFLPHDHPYAADIDLFGNASLYQYINRCTSEQAEALLASSLLKAAPAELVLKRQLAVKELKDQFEWRQQLQSAGMANPLTQITEDKIIAWLRSKTPYTNSAWKVIAQLFPVITLGCLAAYIFDLIPSAIFIMLVFLFYVISLLISRNISKTYFQLSNIVDEVSAFQQQLKHFENLKCNSELLLSMQKDLEQNQKASTNILLLKQILNRFDVRLNVFVFILLNSFLLWDLQQVISLNKWKQTNNNHVKNWIDTIATVEFLSTLATLAFNHPEWCVPKISNSHFTLEAIQVGHPLIKEEKRVDNTFSTKGQGKVNIITGSNMAGKSTFLRSIAVNVVLAQIGAPVCARSFEFSSVQLCTSMRVSDNLAENTSTFYAELKKLKSIIERVNQHEKVFILLDEILRGTNSLDRHTGSEALIKQLIRKDAVAIIATHDVELAALRNEYLKSIDNYHFDVQVEAEELYFDYKLKRGICQSLNASLLMKKIGIEM